MRRTHLVLVLAVIPWFGGVGFAGTTDTCRSVESPNHDIIKVIDKAGKVTISQRAGIADLCPPLKPTSSVPQSTETVIHTDADLGIVVDENGIISALDGSPSDLNAGLAGVVESSSSPVVIDWMTTTGGYTSSYSPGGTRLIVYNPGHE